VEEEELLEGGGKQVTAEKMVSAGREEAAWEPKGAPEENRTSQRPWSRI